MTQKQNLNLKTSLNITMSSKMQEAIKILTMSSQELYNFVQDEIIKNPLLEENENSIADSGYTHKSQKSIKNNTEDFDLIQNMPIEENLKQHIQKQIFPKISQSDDIFIAEVLIDSINDEGYFKANLKKLCHENKISYIKAKNILKKLKQCDPLGIFSETLQECLKKQLKNQNKLTKLHETFINSLNTLHNQGMNALCKEINIDINDAKEILNDIKKLNPKPGLEFCNSHNNDIVCDLILEENNGKFTLLLNEAALPKIFINSTYYNDLLLKLKCKKSTQYLKEQKKQGDWLVQAVKQRTENLLKVANFIVHYQKTFFIHGISGLKPLTLKIVAENTGLHISTVSRITTEKFIQTPRGTLSLKFFFSSQIGATERFKKSKDDISFSSKNVMQHIEKLIKEEEKTQPLSDEDISIFLKQQGLNIARRTIAKYRTQLGIERSSVRKKQI